MIEDQSRAESTLEIIRDGQVATVWLSRPQVRNAFNAGMIIELTAAFETLGQDESIRVIVLRGRGKAFSGGADIQWMRNSLELTAGENEADALLMSDMFATIDRCPRPALAVVHGACLGGGMGLIAACDTVIAADSTTFGFTEVKLGIIPSAISRVVLPKVGESWARALYLTGQRFDASVARRIGLVHWIVGDDELDSTADAYMEEYSNAGPEAVREAKRLIADLRDASDATVRLETAKRIGRVRTGAEGQEGLRAFLEKRPATWRS